MLDYDPPKDADALGRDELLGRLYAAVPQLESAAHLWWPSTGSCIYNTDTAELAVGVRGQRVYVWVSDATQIERLGCIFSGRLWMQGDGRFEVSKSGALLERTLVDAAVWQPERLDFAAGASCTPPLEQRRGAPVRFGASVPLNCALLVDLSDAEREQIEREKALARARVSAEAEAMRATAAAGTAARIQQKTGVSEERARDVARQAIEGRLMGDFILVTDAGYEVTVGEILDNRSKWHQKRFHDPLEPDYPDERIAWVNLYSGGRPYLFSHAHGSRRFYLCRAVRQVPIADGGMAEATDRTLELLLEDGGLYEHAGAIAVVTPDARIQPLGQYALKHEIERVVAYTRWDGRKKDHKRVDCPDEIARRLREMKGTTTLPKLAGVLQYPTMAADGRLLDRPGFDQSTGLLLVNPAGAAWPRVPRVPSEAEVLAALDLLFRPISAFPFKDEVSRGAALAALLTAAVRPSLATAPAFLFSAPAAGSGKTLLASCVVRQAGGAAPMSLPDNDTEIAKLVVSMLRRGTPALFFDNVVGAIDSKTLNAMLTATEFDGRILGSSEVTGGLPTNVLVVMTGNNARPRGDMCRRMLVCTIDPQMEQPYMRQFDFDPLEVVSSKLMELRVAALTVLAGRVATHQDRFASGDFASFGEWDWLVRQTVVWVGELERRVRGADAVGFADPIADVQAQYSADDETESLRDLLETWQSCQEPEGFKASELFTAMERIRRNDCATGVVPLEVAAALVEAAPWVKSTKSLTSWFKNVRGRIVGGLALDCVDDRAANAKRWVVRRP
jgi:hypothetical protein